MVATSQRASTVPFSILVVCVGNVCRSPLAERLFRLRLDSSFGPGSHVSVASAGIRALVGSPMDPASAAELVRLGGAADGFVSRQVDEADLVSADLVLTATKPLRSRVLQDVPSALRRTFTLTEFAALVDGLRASSLDALLADAANRRASAQPETYDLDDPIGAAPEVHREVATVIDRCTRVIAAALAAGATAQGTRR